MINIYGSSDSSDLLLVLAAPPASWHRALLPGRYAPAYPVGPPGASQGAAPHRDVTGAPSDSSPSPLRCVRCVRWSSSSGLRRRKRHSVSNLRPQLWSGPSDSPSSPGGASGASDESDGSPSVAFGYATLCNSLSYGCAPGADPVAQPLPSGGESGVPVGGREATSETSDPSGPRPSRFSAGQSLRESPTAQGGARRIASV